MKMVFLGVSAFWLLIGLLIAGLAWTYSIPRVMGYVGATFLLIGVITALVARKL